MYADCCFPVEIAFICICDVFKPYYEMEMSMLNRYAFLLEICVYLHTFQTHSTFLSDLSELLYTASQTLKSNGVSISKHSSFSSTR